MTINPLLKETILFRPSQEKPSRYEVNHALLRYADGQWLPDDGTPDLAFIDLNNPYAYYVELPYQENLLWSWMDMKLVQKIVGEELIRDANPWHYTTVNNEPFINWRGRDKHPNNIAGERAMDKCSSIHSCANGRGTSIARVDEFNNRIMYVRRDGELVQLVKSDNPVCYLCLNNGQGHKQDAFDTRFYRLLNEAEQAMKSLDRLVIDTIDTKGIIAHIEDLLSKMRNDPLYSTELEKS